jgi:hypothetical protein
MLCYAFLLLGDLLFLIVYRVYFLFSRSDFVLCYLALARLELKLVIPSLFRYL